MHFGIKCIFASNAFLHQMHLMLPLHFVGAEHFPKENVRVAKMHFGIKCILASNAFLHQMHFCIKCIFANQNVRKRQNAVFFALQKTKAVRCVALPKCILASNAFVTFCFAKMHFCINKMLQMHFCVHFPKENVQQTKMLESGKMHFGVHFPKENVQHHIFQRKMFSKTKCYKCI